MHSFNIQESRLIFREMPEPQREKQDQPLDSVKTSLKTLESSTYARILESTKDRAIPVEHGSVIECTDASGTRSFSFKSGNLIQKEKDGYLMISGSSMLFVPNENFLGTITAVKGGKRLILREVPKTEAQAETTPEPKKETKKPSENVTEGITIHFKGAERGITAENGESLTLRSGETDIRNSLGRLTRATPNSAEAVFTPAKGLATKVLVGTEVIYNPASATTPDNVEAKKRPLDEALGQVIPRLRTDKSTPPVPQKRSAKDVFRDLFPPMRGNRAIEEGSGEAEPQQQRMKLRERVENSPASPEVEAAVQVYENYLNNPETSRDFKGSTRQFIRLYIDHWKTVDPQGVLGNRLFQSQPFRQLVATVESGGFSPEPSGLEKKSKEALIAFAEQLAGPENPVAERNAFITQYNQLVRSGQRGDIDDIASMIYDRRYIGNPRGRFNEKVGREPMYRSERTAKMLQFLKERNSTFIRLSNATEAEAPALAKAYRKYDNAYRAIRYMLGQRYEKQWGDKERTITLNDGRARDATLTQRVDAFWKRHLAIDALMVEDSSHQSLVPNQALLRQAEKWLEKYAPEYPPL